MKSAPSRLKTKSDEREKSERAEQDKPAQSQRRAQDRCVKFFAQPDDKIVAFMDSPTQQERESAGMSVSARMSDPPSASITVSAMG